MKPMKGKALLIGNSDGIGLASTKELLKQGWEVTGISRSESPITDSSYQHFVAEVQNDEFPSELKSILQKSAPIDLCIYCAGIGELLDPTNMESEVEIIEVNLQGMVKTASKAIPLMVERGEGHFIGISSVADELLSPEAPSYHASKAGFSNYLESLALALKPKGVYVTNLRFGFVQTKMAKGKVKPFMMNVYQAAQHVMICITKKPIRHTAPRVVIPLIKVRRLMLRLATFF
jgi:short-subunit dehydrogenase